MGAALGRRFAAGGHAVTFSYSRDTAKLERVARQSGPRARAAALADAARDADVLLLAVHWSRVSPVLRGAGSVRGKIVIDCTNPMTPADDALAVGHGVSGGELVARRARGGRGVKGVNTVPAELLRAGPQVLPERPGRCYFGGGPRSKTAGAPPLPANG